MSILLMRFLLGVYVFLYIFNPTIFFSFNLLYILSVVAVLSVPLNFKYYYRLIRDKRLVVYVVFLIYIISYLLVLAFFGGTDAIYTAYNYLLVFLSFFCCLFVVVSYGRLYGLSFHCFFKFLINVGVVQLFFVFMTLLSPDVREFILVASRFDDLWSISNDYGGLRSYGLANGYTATFPMLMGIYALISISMVNKASLLELKYYLYIILFFLFVFSVMLNARIGLVPVIVFYVITLFSMAYFLKVFVFGIQCFLFAGFAFLILLYFGLDLEMYTTRFIWGVEEVVSLFSGEKVGTFIALEEMLHFPKDTMTFFFGSGLTVFGDQDSFPISSDIGFVRDIYMFGFLNTTLLVMVVFYLTGPLRNLLKLNFGRIMVISLFISLSAYYFKGAIWSSSEVYNFIVLLSVFSIYLKPMLVSHEKNSYN